jgi:nucleotide-binding universal stress UspA family protein
MYEHIVVGTDGSGTAGVALQRAIELAKLTGATLHIVHAYQQLSMPDVALSAAAGGPTVDVYSVNAGIGAESVRICDESLAAAQGAGVNAESRKRPGDAAEALIDVAEQVGADLIVVGNRGMSSVRRFMLGSVPNKVSHHCPCSVLIVDTSAASGRSR